jgi:hypothetical protein
LEIDEPEKKQSDDGDGRDGGGARNFQKESNEFISDIDRTCAGAR